MDVSQGFMAFMIFTSLCNFGFNATKVLTKVPHILCTEAYKIHDRVVTFA
jgi:hypothetical protein